MKRTQLFSILRNALIRRPIQAIFLLLTVIGSIGFSLLPPLVLERLINSLTSGQSIPLILPICYFLFLLLSGLFDSGKEIFIIRFGQNITHTVRSAMCKKLSRLPADYWNQNEPGTIVSRFVSDVDTLEALFASGIVSMIVDVCKVLGILIVIFFKSTGLGCLLLIILPCLFFFTRAIQRKMLAAQKDYRSSFAKVSNHVPETVRNIRMIHTFRKEEFMAEQYDSYIQKSYAAMERTNFCDAIYSPVILIVSAATIAVMMILASTGGAMQSFFGMSVGAAVAVVAYVGKIFSPLENIGMEIQSIQSAVAGVHRIFDFLGESERIPTDSALSAQALLHKTAPAIALENVSFSYEQTQKILSALSFQVSSGESLTIVGRTGAGKSTLFKLLLGFYAPQSGHVLIYGVEASRIPDSEKRKIFGYVEQLFHAVPGTIRDQIAVFDNGITDTEIQNAAALADISETILAFPQQYNTPYTEELFSQGQKQLLAIARAIVYNPAILLLDEITANLDAGTEEAVLSALRKASEHRTVLSISHRLYEHTGGKMMKL